MRVTPWIAAAVLLSLATPASAQEWDGFVFADDGFKVNFPSRPQMESMTWTSYYRYTLPEHVYTASDGAARYSATVVDYRDVERQGNERSAHCPPGAETCIGDQDGRKGAINGLGYWKMDVRGALAFATLKFMKRDAKVTDYNLEFEDVVEGYQLQLTNRDESQTFAYITMHENRLYIFEATVPKGSPAPLLFETSIGFVDAQGRGLRYTDYYTNGVHGLRQYAPPPVRVNGVLEGGPPPAPGGAQR